MSQTAHKGLITSNKPNEFCRSVAVFYNVLLWLNLIYSAFPTDIQQLETHIKNRKQRDPVIGQLQQMIDTLQNSQDKLATTVTASVCSDVQRQLHMTVGK